VKKFRSNAGVWWLVLWFLSWISTAPASETIERNPVYRSVSSNWTDLGSVAYPFKTLYVGAITLGGKNFSGGGDGITPVFTNTVTLPAGSQAYVTNVGVIGNIAYYILGVPQGANGANGAAGTNTVTVQNFSNQVLSSAAYISYSTNYARFRVGSNYLGRVPNISHIFATAGDDGANPPNQYGFYFTGSYTGTNGFFYFTNSFSSTFTSSNPISLWLNATSVPAGNPGSVTIQSVDHWELIGRTNYFFGQRFRCDLPNDAAEVANKQYVDQLLTNAFNNNFSSYSDTNGVSHYVWQFQNQSVSDYAGTLTMAPISFLGLDGTGTNLQFQAALTNVAAGVQIQSSTNLAIVTSFLAWTNYTSVTNTGIVTYTVPINPLWPMQFFRVVTASSVKASFYVPLGMPEAYFFTNTLTHSTNSTFGFGAGLVTSDANYIYVSTATNQWGRIAIPTNTW
jgi:hypothetical protein